MAIDNPSYADFKKVIVDELQSHVDAESRNTIKSATMELVSKIGSLQGVNERLSQAEKDIEALKNNSIPKNMKPFNLSYETPFLDSVKLSQGSALAIDLSGLSIRDAKKRLYTFTLQQQKMLDSEVLKEQQKNLRLLCSQETFVNSCMAE
eukprot:6072326-Amphidinium_carterae.1